MSRGLYFEWVFHFCGQQEKPKIFMLLKATMGTQGPGNPDTLLLENQSVQEKYLLETLYIFVEKVNFCLP